MALRAQRWLAAALCAVFVLAAVCLAEDMSPVRGASELAGKKHTAADPGHDKAAHDIYFGKVRKAVNPDAGDADDDMNFGGDSSLGTVLNHLYGKFHKMKAQLNGWKASTRTAKPRVIKVNVRPRGKPGPPGPGGVRGRKGDPGMNGPNGPRGFRGHRGSRGPRGPRGPKGATGRKGKQGRKGKTGPRGAHGPRGGRGAPGVRGTRGNPGAPGTAGSNGHDGPPGPRGPPAPPGPPGPRGKRGPRGPRGAVGVPGPRGPKGFKGSSGPKGNAGRNGKNGRRGPPGSSTVIIPYNALSFGAMRSKYGGRQIRGGLARKGGITWPQGAWTVGLWVYVGRRTPSGATPFSYDSSSKPHALTLTNMCRTIYINGHAKSTGFTCARGRWTHVMISYVTGDLRIFANGKGIKKIVKNFGTLPRNGAITLGQDYSRGHYPQSKALADGQVGAPQIFSRRIVGWRARYVKDGMMKGDVVRNLVGFSVKGQAVYTVNNNVRDNRRRPAPKSLGGRNVVRTCRTGDWGVCRCPKGHHAVAGGCYSYHPYRVQFNARSGPDAWKCGGHGGTKLITVVCSKATYGMRTVTAHGYRWATASCPSNTRLVSGGCNARTRPWISSYLRPNGHRSFTCGGTNAHVTAWASCMKQSRMPRGCHTRVRRTGDWGTNSCPANHQIVGGGCTTSHHVAIQSNRPLNTRTWQCGGWGRVKYIYVRCCPICGPACRAIARLRGPLRKIGVSRQQFRYVEKHKRFRRKIKMRRRRVRRLKRHPRRARRVVRRAKKKRCFPADATVALAGGRTVRMDALRHGDQVATVREDGSVSSSEVFFFGHKVADVTEAFTCLGHAQGGEVCLSGDHFIRASSSAAWAESSYMRGNKVDVGMWVWVQQQDGMVPVQVERVDLKWKRGLYAPYTLQDAMIIVNGVAASTHSEWFLDAATPSSLDWALPHIYEKALWFGRTLYRLAADPLWAEDIQDRLDLVEVAHANDGAAGLLLPYYELLRSELPSAMVKVSAWASRHLSRTVV